MALDFSLEERVEAALRSSLAALRASFSALTLGLKTGAELTATLAGTLVASAPPVDIGADYNPGTGKSLLVKIVEVGLLAMLDVVAYHLLGVAVITSRCTHGSTP